MIVTKRGLAVISKLYFATATAVHEPVTLCGVVCRGGDHFRQIVHISGFDIQDVCKQEKQKILLTCIM